MTIRSFSKSPATAPLMAKAVLPALPVVGLLPWIKHDADELSDFAIERTNVTTDPAHLASYRELCGFGDSEFLPPTYPHLAAFALHLALITDSSFPFAPMGLVHLRNRITQLRPIGIDEPYDVTVRAADLRPHPKGRLVDLLTSVSVDGEEVWNEVTTLLARGSGAAPELSTSALTGSEPPRGVVHWQLASNLGREYAAVSSDRNPIHLYPLTAKAFGFPRNIAHGMWTAARCVAALSNRIGDRIEIDVEFQAPILLPSTVIFGYRLSGDEVRFGIRGQKQDRRHLVGRIRSIQPS